MAVWRHLRRSDGDSSVCKNGVRQRK